MTSTKTSKLRIFKENHPVVYNILRLIIIGLIIILLFDILIRVQVIKEWNLSNLNDISGSLGFVLSIVTIYLLYLNYDQQRKELHDLINQNRNIIAQNKGANELQVILNGKQAIDNTILQLENKMLNTRNSSFDDFLLYAIRFVNQIIINDNDYNRLLRHAENLKRFINSPVSAELARIDIQIANIISVTNNNSNVQLLANCFQIDLVNLVDNINIINFDSIHPEDFIEYSRAAIINESLEYIHELAQDLRHIKYVIDLSNQN